MSQNSHIDSKILKVSRNARNLFFALTVVAVSLTTSCTNNLETFADKGDDEALLYTAKEGLRNANYTAAINACELMTSSFQAGSRAIETCTSAYAGSCGFSVIDMIGYIEDYALVAPTPSLLEWFLGELDFATNVISLAKAADCNTAISILRTAGEASARTDNQNSLMILLSLHTMAQIADSVADTNNDDLLDGAFNPCTTAVFTDAFAQDFGIALWEFDKSTEVLAANALYTPLDTIADTLCSALVALGGMDLCASTTPEALTAPEILGARTAMKDGGFFGVDIGSANTAMSPIFKCP